MNIQQIKDDRDRLQHSLNLLIAQIGPIQIGSVKQFPFGWRKAAKGRTVWRIIEEAITQNIEKHYRELSIDNVHISDSEVSVYDMSCTYAHNKPIYINIKSAVIGGKKNKDDISKAEGLVNFYKQDPDRNFFVATFFIKFNANMTIEIVRAVVFPIAWIKDIYVNPSNNGNLQSAYYKDLNDAIYRTNEEFLPLFYQAVELAAAKKKEKTGAVERKSIKFRIKRRKSVKAKKRKRCQKQYSKSHSNMRHQKKVPNLKHIQVWHAPKTENRF